MLRVLVLTAIVAASASQAAAAAKSAAFFSPLRPGVLGCTMSDPSGLGYNVYCQFDPVNSPRLSRLVVKMGADGRFTLCRKRCPIAELGEGTRALGYGKQATVGRFRCQSLRSGVRCTAIRSGKGFLISSKGVHAVEVK
jgi:hypothetical protein